jgi:hypothetical protein
MIDYLCVLFVGDAVKTSASTHQSITYRSGKEAYSTQVYITKDKTSLNWSYVTLVSSQAPFAYKTHHKQS